MSKQYLSAKDLSELLGVSVSHSYKFIKLMNMELQEKGFLTVRGKVPTAYAKKRFFFEGIAENEEGVSDGISKNV